MPARWCDHTRSMRELVVEPDYSALARQSVVASVPSLLPKAAGISEKSLSPDQRKFGN
jgi:hypothetical protein